MKPETKSKVSIFFAGWVFSVLMLIVATSAGTMFGMAGFDQNYGFIIGSAVACIISFYVGRLYKEDNV